MGRSKKSHPQKQHDRAQFRWRPSFAAAATVGNVLGRGGERPKKSIKRMVLHQQILRPAQSDASPPLPLATAQISVWNIIENTLLQQTVRVN